MEVIPEETEFEAKAASYDNSYLKYAIEKALQISRMKKVHEEQLDKTLKERKLRWLEQQVQIVQFLFERETFYQMSDYMRYLIYRINNNNFDFYKMGISVQQGVVFQLFNKKLWLLRRAQCAITKSYCDNLGFHVHLNAINQYHYQVQYSFFSDQISDCYFLIVEYDFVNKTFVLLDIYPRPLVFKQLCEGLANSQEMMYVLSWVRKFFKHHINAKEFSKAQITE